MVFDPMNFLRKFALPLVPNVTKILSSSFQTRCKQCTYEKRKVIYTCALRNGRGIQVSQVYRKINRYNTIAIEDCGIRSNELPKKVLAYYILLVHRQLSYSI